MPKATQTLRSQYERAQTTICDAEAAKVAVSAWGTVIGCIIGLIVVFSMHLAWTGQWSSLPVPLYLLSLGLVASFIYCKEFEERHDAVVVARRSQSVDLASDTDFDAVEYVLGGEVEEVFESDSQLEAHAPSWLLNRAERDSDFAGRLADAGFAFKRIAPNVAVLDRLT